MEPIDYTELVEPSSAAELADDRTIIEPVYSKGDGLRLTSARGPRFSHEMVRVSGDALLLVSDSRGVERKRQQQIVTQNDWVHFQYRIKGSGSETVSGTWFDTPARSCVLARYPENSLIDRVSHESEHWQVACLYLRPRGIASLLDADSGALPDQADWLTLPSSPEVRTQQLPLRPGMAAAIGDMIACSFEGAIRRAYMRAKAVELLTSTLDALTHEVSGARLSLSPSDARKMHKVKAFLDENPDQALSLHEIARLFGLNRSKLAMGFKEAFGETVQGYWRDLKLARAQELLQGNLSVTEIALTLGYRELSSFSRAFVRRYGVPPSDFRAPQRSQLRLPGPTLRQ